MEDRSKTKSENLFPERELQKGKVSPRHLQLVPHEFLIKRIFSPVGKRRNFICTDTTCRDLFGSQHESFIMFLNPFESGLQYCNLMCILLAVSSSVRAKKEGKTESAV
jgi:hypothetical protein